MLCSTGKAVAAPMPQHDAGGDPRPGQADVTGTARAKLAHAVRHDRDADPGRDEVDG
jgi:hypothetical protein